MDMVCDVTDEGQVDSLVDTAVSKFGGLEVVGYSIISNLQRITIPLSRWLRTQGSPKPATLLTVRYTLVK